MPSLISWASILEDDTRQQAELTAKLPFIYPHLALMPDAHLGYGSTVGSVIPTLGVVIPAAVGVDIGCGMSASRTALTKENLVDLPPLSQLRTAIEREIPLSMGNYRSELSDTGRQRHQKLVDRAELDNVNPERFAKNWHFQLGTLGSGNHFIEICLDEQDRIWAFLHSGSRGVGKRIADYHIKVAKQQCARWHIALPHPDLAYLPEGDSGFWDYLADLRWAQEFAAENRSEMVDAVIRCMTEWAGAGVTREEIITCHHNYTAQEWHYNKLVWVTRKGAINAEPGRRGLIPGSMGTRSYVVTGKGFPPALKSAPHGAGRNFSRTEARRRFTTEELAQAMEGIEWRKDNAEAFLDEIPGAYKDIDRVMKDAEELVQVDHVLRQILNVKGD